MERPTTPRDPQPHREDPGTLTSIGRVVYGLLGDSLTVWAVLIGVPVISVWALYNNYPAAAITIGAVTIALAGASWWFLRRRSR